MFFIPPKARLVILFFVCLVFHQMYTLTVASAPPLARMGVVGWKAREWTPSLYFLRWEGNSWVHACVLMSQNRTEESWPPDTRPSPLGLMAKQLTASRCATIEFTHDPVLRSKKRIYLSSCPVMAKGSVG